MSADSGAKHITRRRIAAAAIIVETAMLLFLAGYTIWGGEDEETPKLYFFRHEDYVVPSTDNGPSRALMPLYLNVAACERYVQSVRDEAPMVIKTALRNACQSGELSAMAKEGMEEIPAGYSLSLGAMRTSDSNWTRLRGWVGLPKPISRNGDTFAGLGRSDVLYVQTTPQGGYYLSTDKKGQDVVGPRLIEDGPELPKRMCDAMLEHWSGWIAESDRLLAEEFPAARGDADARHIPLARGEGR